MFTSDRAFSRRRALQGVAGLAAGSLLPAWFAEQALAADKPQEPRSANDMPGVALVGCGGRGRGVAKEAQKFGKLIAVCDVDSSRAEGAALELKAAHTYSDFRKLLERDDVHVVVNGTPDHWHTIINIAALKSGKDVYSEKPLTLTIDEGRKLVAVVKQTGRVLQTGSQQRSDAKFRMVCELVRNGRLGKLTRVTTVLPAGLNKGPFKEQPVPKSLDWDTWLGQAPKVPYVPERCHVNFRFWYDYSGGTITDWGAHHNDIALWGMGTERTGPVSVEGQKLVEQIPGGYTAASQYIVRYTWENGVEHVCKTTTADSIFGGPQGEPPPGETRNGVIFEGTEGRIYIRRGHIDASDPELLKQELPSSAERLYASNDHMGNFFDCVRSRKAPICEAEIGHRSVSVCHLGSIALRLGRKLKWDPQNEQFVGDDEANGYVARQMRKPWTLEEAHPSR
jgi:myo-inositol 2-dehydrogenase / D-chiro-inositol 1-dehydrogenase